MADQILYLTELLGLKVFDLKGRKLGAIKDAAVVPIVHPSRIDRYLVGGGWAWLTVRYELPTASRFTIDRNSSI
jgi:magnesium transporter